MRPLLLHECVAAGSSCHKRIQVPFFGSKSAAVSVSRATNEQVGWVSPRPTPVAPTGVQALPVDIPRFCCSHRDASPAALEQIAPLPLQPGRHGKPVSKKPRKCPQNPLETTEPVKAPHVAAPRTISVDVQAGAPPPQRPPPATRLHLFRAAAAAAAAPSSDRPNSLDATAAVALGAAAALARLGLSEGAQKLLEAVDAAAATARAADLLAAADGAATGAQECGNAPSRRASQVRCRGRGAVCYNRDKAS